jgi:hypothetical protein
MHGRIILHAQVSMDQIRIQVRGNSGGNDPPAVHEVEAVPDLLDEVEVLLDHDDRHSPFVDQAFQNTSYLLDDIRLDTLCGLVQQQCAGRPKLRSSRERCRQH